MSSGGASCPGIVRLTGRSVLSRHLVHLLQSLSPRIARSSIAAIRRQRRLDFAVSPEAAPASSDDASAEDARFPVLIDHGGKVAEQFGLTFEMDDAAEAAAESALLNADAMAKPLLGTFLGDR